MFDVGFWELSIIAVVALIVIGPERLPKLARTAGHWIGMGRRFVANVKADIDKEIKADELKQILEQQAQKANPLHEVIEETRGDLQSIKQETEKTVNDNKKAFEDSQTSNADK